MRISSKFAIFLSILFTLISFKPAYSDSFLGLTGGLNYANSSSKYTGYEQRFNLGLFYLTQLDIEKKISIQFELGVSQKGSEGGDISIRGEMSDDIDRDDKYSHRDYVELNGVLKTCLTPALPVRANLIFGLSSGYLLHAEDKYIDVYYNSLVMKETDYFYKRPDLAILVGFGLERIFKEDIFQIDIRYSYGLVNILKDYWKDRRNQSIALLINWGIII